MPGLNQFSNVNTNLVRKFQLQLSVLNSLLIINRNQKKYKQNAILDAFQEKPKN